MHVKELLSLKGKIILVTGGAGYYGKFIVEGLAEADGTVITASRNLSAGQELAKKCKAKGLDVHAMQVDQTDHKSVLSLKEAIANQFSGLDVFVNNAVGRPMHHYTDPLENWIESMRVEQSADFIFEWFEWLVDRLKERGRDTRLPANIQYADWES